MPQGRRFATSYGASDSRTKGLPLNTALSKAKKLKEDYNYAQSIVYEAFKIAGEKVGQDPKEMFNTALNNIMPMVEVKARRVGGANYQVPIEIRPERRQTLAIRWLVAAARKRSEREMSARLSAELVDAFNNTGNAVKKKEDTHRMAEANRAFAHYRF